MCTVPYVYLPAVFLGANSVCDGPGSKPCVPPTFVHVGHKLPPQVTSGPPRRYSVASSERPRWGLLSASHPRRPPRYQQSFHSPHKREGRKNPGTCSLKIVFMLTWFNLGHLHSPLRWMQYTHPGTFSKAQNRFRIRLF